MSDPSSSGTDRVEGARGASSPVSTIFASDSIGSYVVTLLYVVLTNSVFTLVQPMLFRSVGNGLPYVPGICFGLLLYFVARAVRLRAYSWVILAVFATVGWNAAIRESVVMTEAAAKVVGTGSYQPYLTGATGGLVGGLFCLAGLSLASPAFRKPQLWLRSAVVATLAGMILLPWTIAANGLESVYFLILLIGWQSAVALDLRHMITKHLRRWDEERRGPL